MLSGRTPASTGDHICEAHQPRDARPRTRPINTPPTDSDRTRHDYYHDCPHDLTRVHPGDRIEAWVQGHLRHTGTVSQAVPHRGVLWILQDATGIPMLIPAHDYRLHHISAALTA